MRTINLETLEVKIQANDSNVSETVDKVSDKFKGLGDTVDNSTSRISQKMVSVNNAVDMTRTSAMNLGSAAKATAAVFATTGLLKFGSSCLELSSALAEVQNVVDVTFGKMNTVINEFAQNAQDQFGMSELAAKQYAGTIGAILSSMGYANEQATVMSMNLTSLAGDIASFYNIDQDQAFEKLRSAMSGETEAIKSLGINMSVANLNAYALSTGLGTTYDKLDTLSQATLRYNYIMQATSNQQGDFARTSESWANQTRTLTQEWDTFKSTIGATLEQVLLPMLQVVNKIIGGFNDLLGIKSKVSDSSDAVSDLSNSTDNVSNAFANTASNANKTAKGIKNSTNAAKALKNALMGFDEINRIDGQDASGTGGLSNLDAAATAAKNLANNISDAYGYTNSLNKVFDSTDGNMSKYFGGVALNMDQIKSVAAQIVNNKDLEKMTELTQKVNNMDKLADNINSAKQTIDSYNWMISVGMELTKEDKEKYIAAINSFVDDCNKYVTEQKEAVSIACQIVFGAGSEQETEFNNFYNGVQGQLTVLGNKIKKKVNDSWADGVISIDEAKEIQNLTNQQYKIMNALNDAEFSANLEFEVKSKFSGVDLTQESYEELLKELQNQLDTYNKGQDDAAKAILIGLKARLNMGEIDQKEFDTEYKKLMDSVNKNKADKAEEVLKFQMNTVIEMIYNDKDISKVMNNFSTNIEKYFNDNMNDMKLNFGSSTYWNDLLTSANTKLSQEITKVSPEQRKIIENMLKNLEPTEKQLKELKKSCEDAGTEVPESVSNGLTQINALKALTGDVDAMYYLMGNQMSDSEEFKTAIRKAKESGVNLPSSLVDGMNSKKVDLTKGVDGILDVAEQTLNKDTSVKTAANKKGTEASNEIKSGMTSNTAKNNVTSGSNSLIDGIKKGLSASLGGTGKNAFWSFKDGFYSKTNVTSITESAKKISNGAKDGAGKTSLYSTGKSLLSSFRDGLKNKDKLSSVKTAGAKISTTAMGGTNGYLAFKNSKSTTYQNYGKYTVQGFNAGIDGNRNSTNGAIDRWTKGMNNRFTSYLGIHSPSRLFKSFGGYTVEGYNIGIEDNMDTTSDVLENWADVMNGFCDDIDLGTIDAPKVATSVPTADFAELTGSTSQQSSVTYDRPANIVLKIGTSEFAKISVDSINKLIRQEGEMVLDMSYV